jgi:hypothetical protein
VTTPAQDAPLVFPSVAFRPLRLFAICVLLAGLVTAAAALLHYPMFGVFFGIGLALGLLNALLVRRAVDLAIAFTFRPMGLGVVFGLALFQVVLVLSTSLPVLKQLRAGDAATNDGSAPKDSSAND